ncbi:hypothetical protein LINPERPRIM_LOCUS39051 [Linum perenne]
MREPGKVSIVVEEEGIKERVAYLERCVVFRFVGEENLRWSVFREWAARNWGIPQTEEFFPLADDLWLLECSSSADVSRILALNRRDFGSFQIFLDSWTKVAGRSRVAWDANVVWVSVRGIPLHFRSQALARSVREVCGEFLDSAGGADLSSLRVKVRVKGGLPDVIPLSVGGEVFPVTVVPEVGFPLPPVVPKEVARRSQKGKEVFSEKESSFVFPNSISTPGECSSPAVEIPEVLGVGTGGAAPEVSSLAMVTSLSTYSEQMRRQKGSALMDVGRSERVPEAAEGSVQKGKELVRKEAAPFLGICLTSDGLCVGNFKLKVDEWALGNLDVDRTLWTNALMHVGLPGWL